MSNRKPRALEQQPERRRFSGPELSDLLDRVVAEHGETAAISAVNRVRSGGVAGFFCREEFEVIVGRAGETDVPIEPDPDSEPDIDLDSEPDPVPGPDPYLDLHIEPDPALGSKPDLQIEPDPEPGPDPDLQIEPDPDPGRELGSDADLQIEPDPDLGRELDSEPRSRPERPVFAAPTPPGPDRGQDRFLALLERRLDETSSTEAELSRRRLDLRRSADPAPVAPAPGSIEPPARDEAATIAPSRRPWPALEPEREPERESERERERESEPELWERLRRAEAELAGFLPTDSPVTAVIGPLPLALAVARRIRSPECELRSSSPRVSPAAKRRWLHGRTLEIGLISSPEGSASASASASAEVFVLTDRAGIGSEPAWELVRNANRLVEVAARRAEVAPAERTVLVVDAPPALPDWLGPLQHRLRRAGVGLFRYAVPGRPTTADLERFRQGTDVPFAIDLVSRVDPGWVVELLADRHPVLSVAGVDLSPELLLALRGHIDRS